MMGNPITLCWNAFWRSVGWALGKLFVRRTGL
jgi:hypothetical protein